MNLQKMMELYHEEGLTRELAAARVCQDIVLKAIAIGPLNRNVTIKGGVVMQSLSKNNRRATRDIDLDFIHYSLEDDSIRAFVKNLDCIPGIKVDIIGGIEELKHQDYHGKSIKVRITDDFGTSVESKIDIGVHKHLELEQEEYCFDVCMDEQGGIGVFGKASGQGNWNSVYDYREGEGAQRSYQYPFWQNSFVGLSGVFGCADAPGKFGDSLPALSTLP